MSTCSEVAPGVRAAADQRLAAISYVEHAWPQNRHLVNDARVEAALLAAVAAAVTGYGVEWRNGVGYLLVPALGGAYVELEPGTDLHTFVRRNVPAAPSSCDRCDRLPTPEAGRFGWLVLPYPPHLVALSVCDDCATELNRDYRPLPVWIDKE